MSLPDAPELSEHQLSHVLSGLQEEFGARTVEPHEISSTLMDAGYSAVHINQVLAVWFAKKCTSCGKPATHQFGVIDEKGLVSSMEGIGHLSLSCDDCCGKPEDVFPEHGVIRAPLEFELDPEPTHFRIYEAMMAHPGLLRQVVQGMANEDAGIARQELAGAVKDFALKVAEITRNEIHQESFASVLLDVLSDAWGSA